MTEDDAKTKDCCGPSPCGEVSKASGRRTCAASACMAWRWRFIQPIYERTDRGYCGLAGRHR